MRWPKNIQKHLPKGAGSVASQAAQTIRTKVQFDFYELPADSYGSLRDSMLNHIDRPVENQLWAFTKFPFLSVGTTDFNHIE